MRNTGMSRPMDDLGRVVIPKELRDALEIRERDRLNISVKDGAILLEPEREHCTMCGTEGALAAGCNGHKVCVDCMVALNRSVEE